MCDQQAFFSRPVFSEFWRKPVLPVTTENRKKFSGIQLICKKIFIIG
jgi:hypothetical protein